MKKIYVVVVIHFDEDTLKPSKRIVVRKAFLNLSDAINERESQWEKHNYECAVQLIEMPVIG